MDDVLLRRARRALELGRLRHALLGATLVGGTLVAASLWVPGGLDPRWVVVPFAAWLFVAWRGGALAHGGLTGLALGAAGWLVPMAVLRPCCATMGTAVADCCTRPECCLETGALLGAVAAIAAPMGLARDLRTLSTRLSGTLLVAGAVLAVRCAGLFVGESIGLLGGLAIGTLVLGGVRAVVLSRRARPA